MEPSIQALPNWERLLASFFQVMTAGTTVGFNTIPIGALSASIIMFLYMLMIFGASPSGTGGGLKSTTLAALIGLMRSVLKGRDKIRYQKREISADRLQLATAAFTFYMGVLFLAMILLLSTEEAALEIILFEAISALGTVGLSMGLTGDLTNLGKLIIIVLMFMGRVGILTFGIAVSTHDETREEEKDNDLVL
jgi:trk system potassium uptake protein TrkH